MVRSIPVILCPAIFALAGGSAVWAQPRPGPPPVTYELMIDGESFLVEANRIVKLYSKEKPGVSYRVAIRVAAVQRLKLNNLQFECDQRSQVEDSRRPQRRSMKLRHELGFSVLVTDLGEPLDKANRDKALDLLTQSIVKTLRQGNPNAREVTATRLPNHQFEGAEGRGMRIRRRDPEGIDHSTLVYLLVGKTFTASCLVEFLDADGDDVLPLVRKTLDSIRPLDPKPSDPAKPSPN